MCNKGLKQGQALSGITIKSTQEEKESSKVGLRFNEGKLPLDQVPPSMLYSFAEVARYGEKKYCKHNYRKGMAWSTVFGCALRHLYKWFIGEELDDESGLPHLSHALWNITALIEYRESNVGEDDRWHKSNPSKGE